MVGFNDVEVLATIDEPSLAVFCADRFRRQLLQAGAESASGCNADAGEYATGSTSSRMIPWQQV